MQSRLTVVIAALCMLLLQHTKHVVGSGMDTGRLDSRDQEETDAHSVLPSLIVNAFKSYKRACNGFPCMYSHLGTKAGRASLYKILASFIDDCFSDPACNPGRRKRLAPSQFTGQLLNIPISELVRWRMRNME
ncbi:uncharacterized protein LOC127868337 [Dreissena polymorpha]|uniref:Uncharacterized protein n=1 Tax=Dreissena polymorpha TaxID=45954 RepID=A0A9D4M4S0_DREPO|nr:uncharacterized protein LOC127868337 [Dreissena polymorpha]KAH3870770.1 hypothetical protein DPMN_033960 [Dreissena polymorpha]